MPIVKVLQDKEKDSAKKFLFVYFVSQRTLYFYLILSLLIFILNVTWLVYNIISFRCRRFGLVTAAHNIGNFWFWHIASNTCSVVLDYHNATIWYTCNIYCHKCSITQWCVISIFFVCLINVICTVYIQILKLVTTNFMYFCINYKMLCTD